jgi:PAS domain S-box-containing protein
LRPPRRWQLNLAFYVIAAIGVLTIVATMYLSEMMRDVIRGFNDTDRFWAERLAMLTELGQAAVELNVRAKPDGEADAATIRMRRKSALQNFDWILGRAQDGLHSPLTESEATNVARQIGDIVEEVNALVAASNTALDRSSAGDLAGTRAATVTMDRVLSRIAAAIANLQRTVQNLQRQALADQQRSVDDIEYLKYVFAAIVLVLVAGSLFVGMRVTRLTREADDHRRRYLEATEQREQDLQLANERLEATIAERTTALRVGETKFRTLISNIPGVSYRCADDADYTMEFISDAIEPLSGYPASDFIDNAVRTYGSVIHPEDVDEVARIVADGLKRKRPYEIEYRVVHKDGSVHRVFERGQGVFDEAGKAIYCDGVIFDVTDRRHVEDELKRTQMRLTDALESMSEGFILWDADERLVTCNSRYSELFAMSGDLMTPGRTFEQIVRSAVERGQYPEAAADPEGWILERVRRHRMGQSGFELELAGGRWLRVTDRRTAEGGIVGIRADITERRRMETELRESETKFRTLLSNVPGACYRCAYDTVYTMEFISDAIADISGYPAADFIGNRVRTYASIIHPDDLQMVSRIVDEARTARLQSSIEYRIVHRDGSVRWVYERGQGIYDADGRILHIDGAIFDITARKHLEEQVVGQKQMATIGQVAATVSHELRNPLGAISNSMAFLRQMTANRQLGVEKALDRVDRNIERCNTIISDLLDYTSQKELSRAPTALSAWLTELLGEHGLPDYIVLQLDLGADDEVVIDREKFSQVVTNLVENAAQALQDPAWSVPDGHELRITVRTESAGPHVRLAVIDTGPGIPEHVLPRIFEPLFTTKSFGVGLGLPTVRQIVEQHGGTLHVESAANAGTTFTIFLPRHGEAVAHATDPGTRGAAA